MRFQISPVLFGPCAFLCAAFQIVNDVEEHYLAPWFWIWLRRGCYLSSNIAMIAVDMVLFAIGIDLTRPRALRAL
jgi:hypothetical protein